MRIKIACFGVLHTVFDAPEREIELPGESARVDEVLDRLASDYPAFSAHRRHTACAVGDRLVDRDSRLAAGDTLVLLPPVSGG